jgi:glutamate-5-semialdehyde dehydrogenase
MAMDVLSEQGARVKAAAHVLALSSNQTRCAVLLDVASELLSRSSEILTANGADLDLYGENGPGRDRLVLSETRLAAMAQSLRDVVDLSDPLYEVTDQRTLANGLEVEQMRVALGVVGVIYENRPNVTTDVAGLCIRSGNAAFLRGSSSALRTNELLVAIWADALQRAGLPRDAVSLVSDPSHDAAARFMAMSGVIDCLIPRGGPSLIAAMREHARVPYVLDGDGNCHVYVDAAADLDMALAIVVNSKTSRPGVCNAAESLLVHTDVAQSFLPRLATAMSTVQLRGDERSLKFLPDAQLATDADFAAEFLDLILAVAVVDSLDAAIAHVARFSSGHSEAIVTNDDVAAARWVREVDAAAVLVNASTRFVDGGELGLGAEVGISTQKLHARGPMGLKQLTCLKWVIKGKGQIR